MERNPLHRYTEPLIFLMLAGACYLMFFYGLGDIGFLGPDEPRYAAVAREMYLSGDYITPRLHGVPWFEKPVLMYWGAALGYAVFGINEFGARLPAALGASICILLVYVCVRRLWGQAVALIAALILLSSVGFFAFARAASMDMPLTTCLTLALASFLIAYNENGPYRRWWFYAFYALVGLGILAKGPIAVALPAASLIAFTLVRRSAREWKSWHPEGVLITIGIAAPWYVASTWIHGWEFIDVAIINHNFQRFASTIHGHDRPFYFYIPVFMMLTFPWTFLIIPLLRRRLDANEQILAWWAIVPLVLFSFSGSKLPGYILPVVPATAILFARELWNPPGKALRTAVLLEAGCMLFIGVAFGFFGHMLNVDPHVDGRLIAGVAFALAAMLTVLGVWVKAPFVAALNFLAIALLILATISFVFPRFDKTDTMRPWETALSAIVPADEMVFMYKPSRWMEYGLQYYRHNHAVGVFSNEELVGATKSGDRILCIADDHALEELSRATNVEMQVVQTIGNQTAFWAWSAQ